MFPSHRFRQFSAVPHAQRGFALVSAIFLLLVLSALGAMMLTFSSVQHATSAQDLQGGRAYQAARAGLEWGLYQVSTPAVAPPAAACNGALTGMGGALSAFSVTIECTRLDYLEADEAVAVYEIRSTARQGTVGSPYYVERSLMAVPSRRGN